MVRHPRALLKALPDLLPPAQPRLTSRLGIALGAVFAVCFATGLLSHYAQHPLPGLPWPARPAGLYRFTQGLHVMAGLICVPLLGAKLWSVHPKLFRLPPFSSLAGLFERADVAALVSSSLLLVASGILNIAHWYAPMPFYFPAGHYWAAWLCAGALLIHIAVQLPVVRDALGNQAPPATAPGTLTRRGLLGTVAATAGLITIATAGQTLAPLSPLSVLAPRRPRTGPQGLPVNKTAAAAGVLTTAADPGYRLVVAGATRTLHLSLADLRAMPQHTVTLPIACVEGWSADGTWTGVRLHDLAALAGLGPGGTEAVIDSLQKSGRYRSSTVAAPVLRDPDTLVALRLNGEELHADHGYPARLIAPGRPGVLQTKWIGSITLRRTA